MAVITIVGEAFVALRPDISGFAGEAKSKIGEAMKNPLVIAGAAVAAVGASVTAFAASSIGKFSSVASEVKQLSLRTGESTETMSRLRFAAQQTKVSSDVLGAGIKNLSVGISTNSKAVQNSGIAFHDANGKVKPLSESLGAVAEKFKNMPNGVDKNTEAVKLFGKQGLELLPFLNQGRDGLAALAKKSDEYGLTLTGKNLEAIKQNAEAHKNFDAAMEGLQLRVGTALMPAMADLATFMSTTAVPVILNLSRHVGDLATWLGDRLAPVWLNVKKKAKELIDYMRTDVWPWIVTQWQNAKPTVERLWTDVGDAFKKVKKAIVDDVIPALDKFKDLLTGPVAASMKGTVDYLNDHFHNAFTGANALAVTGMAVGLSELTAAVRELRAVIIGSSAWAVLTGEMKLASLTIMGVSLPIIAVVAAIGALVAGAIYAYTHFKGFHDAVDAVGHAIKEGFGVAVDYVVKNIWPTLHQVLLWMQEQFDKLLKWAREEWPAFRDAIGKVLLWVREQFDHLLKFAREEWPAFQEAITHVFNVIKFIVEPIVRDIAGVVYVAFLAIKALWDWWGPTVIGVLQVIWDIILTVIKTAVTVIADTIRFWLDVINGDWGAAWDHLKHYLSTVAEAIWSILGNLFGIMWAIFQNALGPLAESWRNTWNWIKDHVLGVWAGIIAEGRVVIGFFADLPGRILGFFSGAAGWLYNAGKDIVWGIINGISDMNVWLVNKMRDLAGNASEEFKKALKPGSPSRLFAELARSIPQGIAVGIDAEAHLPRQALARVLGGIGAPGLGGRGAPVLTAVGGSSSVDININVRADGASAETVSALRSVAQTEIAGALRGVLRATTAGAGGS